MSHLHQIGLIKQSISNVHRQRQRQIRLGGREDDIQPNLVYEINDIGRKFVKFGFE